MISADHIDRWASETVGANAIFPELIRRLVHALNDSLTHVDIPSGTSVHLGGWDGLTFAERATPFVPEGRCAWECSVESSVTTKANSDYKKRTENSLGLDPLQSTYIFCTPRKWSTKKTWLKSKTAENKWNEVRAVDAHDLATLFDRAPAVRDWFARQLGLSPPGSFAATEWLSDYLGVTDPPLDATCLLLNHEAAKRAIIEHITSNASTPSKLLPVVSRTTTDAIAFCCAALTEIENQDQRFHAISRALVVENADAWKILSALNFTSLILIPTFRLAETDVGRARIHRVIVATSGKVEQGTGDSAVDSQMNDGSNRQLMEKLTELGIKKPRAQRLVSDSGGRITVVRQSLLTAPMSRPDWSEKEHASLIAPFLLCGSWAGTNEHDVAVVSHITGLSATDIDALVRRWEKSSPPLFKLQENCVQLDAPIEAWRWLAPSISSAAWQRYFERFKEVFAELNPKYELPPDERWYANVVGKIGKFSGLLRTSMGEALVRLSIDSRSMQLPSGFRSNESCVEYQYRKLFETNAQQDRFLCSLASGLPTIAEAAPEALLTALEHDLDGPNNVERMFEVSDWHSSSGHASLLWALERLAWSKDHFTRSIRVLTQLCAIPLPENYGNNPFSSLASIFRGWQVATSVSYGERTAALTALFKLNEDVAWRLALSLLPHRGRAAQVPHGPDYRNWADDAAQVVLMREYQQYCRQILDVACAEAAARAVRCVALLGRFFNHSKDEQARILVTVETNLSGRLNRDESTVALWIAVKRCLFGPNSEKLTAAQDKDDSIRIRLLSLHEALVPPDLPSQHAWLFANNQWNLPLPELTGFRSDWKEREPRAKRAQQDGISRLAAAGFDQLIATAQLCENSWLFGVLVAESKLVDIDSVIPLLTCDEPKFRTFASAFVNANARIESNDGSLLSQQKLSALTTEEQLKYLLSLSPTVATFTYVSSLLDDMSARYWAAADFQWIEEDALTFAAQELLKAGRPLQAISALNLRLVWNEAQPALRSLDDAQLVHDVLFAAFRVDASDESTAKRFGHEAEHMSQLLSALAESSFDRDKVGHLEFVFLPIGHRCHAWHPRVLLKAIGESHEQFCELLSLAYKRDDGSTEDGEQNFGVAQSALQLLDDEAWYPANECDGNANVERIRAWILSALNLASSAGRRATATRLIARALGRLGARSGPDWPAIPMAQLLEELHSESFAREVIHGEMYGFGPRTVEFTDDSKRAEVLYQRATDLRLSFPHVAKLLRALSEAYRRESF